MGSSDVPTTSLPSECAADSQTQGSTGQVVLLLVGSHEGYRNASEGARVVEDLMTGPIEEFPSLVSHLVE